jgi:hypothetical protein
LERAIETWAKYRGNDQDHQHNPAVLVPRFFIHLLLLKVLKLEMPNGDESVAAEQRAEIQATAQSLSDVGIVGTQP